MRATLLRTPLRTGRGSSCARSHRDRHLLQSGPRRGVEIACASHQRYTKMRGSMAQSIGVARRRFSPTISFVVVVVTFWLLATGDAGASCDVFPGVSPFSGGALGMATPPFATPGDPVEIALRPCDPTAPPLTTGVGFV